MTSVKVALYARVSKDDASQDPENQLVRLRQHVMTNDMIVVAEYVDRCSGADLNKPERTRLLSDARGHRFSVVLCTKIDRISRSTMDFYTFLKGLGEAHVRLLPIDQPELGTDSPTGELLMAVLAGVAQFERSLIRSRTCDGLDRAKAQGKRLGRPPSSAKTEEMMRLKQQGLTVAVIAAKFGMSRQSVKQRLRRGRLHKGSQELP